MRLIETITFTDASTPEANTNIVSWLWSFGDEANTTSTEQSPTFTYTKEGVYNVTLTVTDNHNLKATLTQSITVLDPVGWPSLFSGLPTSAVA